MNKLLLTAIVFTTATAPLTCAKADSLELILGSKHGGIFGDDYYYTKTEVPEYRASGVGLQSARVGYTRYDRHNFNESNLGIAYVGDNGINVGVYNNSYSDTSVYVGYSIETSYSEYVTFGALAGVVTGYEKAVMPMAQGYMLVGPKCLQGKLGVIPGAFTFGLRVPL
jgi:hypothetical protein